jgi:hypothetical protein
MNATLQSWAHALGGEVSGGEVRCPGPGHSAEDRSLSVTIGKDGQPIVHSFSGDDWKLCLDYVRSKLGMEPFKPNGQAEPARKRHFDYCGPDGALLYQVEREDLPSGGKKIRQRRPERRLGLEPRRRSACTLPVAGAARGSRPWPHGRHCRGRGQSRFALELERSGDLQQRRGWNVAGAVFGLPPRRRRCHFAGQ